MSRRSFLPDSLYQYLLEHSGGEPELLRRLHQETLGTDRPEMQIAPDQGRFFALLVKAMRVKLYLEIGVFTGYSSLCVAMAMPEDGKIVACDISEEYTSIAQRYWKEAGVDHKIDLRLAPAEETLRTLLQEGRYSTFDLAFIDADKILLPSYFESCLQLVRPGGIIAIDNVLRAGKVADPSVTDDADVNAMRSLNSALRTDARVEIVILGMADGITLALKK